MFIVLPYAFALRLDLSKDYLSYFKARYAGYLHEKYEHDLFGSILHGDNILQGNHEVIRPPVGRGKNLFLFDTSQNTLTANFHDIFVNPLRIEISSKFNKAFLGNFIEYLYYLHLKRIGKTLIHCSSFELNGEVILCPAWRNTGKTNLLINALSVGALYLADDWVICDRVGKIEVFPKSVNIEHYNIRSLFDWSFECTEAKLLNAIENFIEGSKYFDRDAKTEILTGAQFFIPLDLIPKSKLASEQQPIDVDKVYWLNWVSSIKPSVDFHDVTALQIQKHIFGTRLLEHYPFELLMSVNLDLNSQEISQCDELEKNGLANMLSECKQLTRVDLSDQDQTPIVLERILKDQGSIVR